MVEPDPEGINTVAPATYTPPPRDAPLGSPFFDNFDSVWFGLHGKPYITVSSKGIANGLSDIPNDGADFGPDTPNTQTYGIQEAVNYIFAHGGSGEILIKNGIYYIYTVVHMPSLFLNNGVLTLLTPDGNLISPPSIDRIYIRIIGESRDGVIIYNGDGVTMGGGGFKQAQPISYSVETTYWFENMTWKPHPNYPTDGAISPAEPAGTMFNCTVSAIIMKHMRLEGKIGQNNGFAVFTGSSSGYGGFLNYFEDIQERYIPGINTAPTGRVLTIFKDIDLWNSGYTDNAIAINASNTNGEGLIIIDGLVAGQDVSPPSTGFTAGGSALFMLAGGTTAGGTTNSTIPVIGRKISIYPSITPSTSTFFSAQWNNTDLEIDAFENAPYLGQFNNGKLKLRQWIYSSDFSQDTVVFGLITNSLADIEIYNLSGVNLGSTYGNINLQGDVTNSTIKVSVFGNAVSTGTALITGNSSSLTYSNVILDGDLTAQIVNSPNTPLLSNVSIAKIAPTIKPSVSDIAKNLGISTPSVPASGTAQQNTNPYPVKVYINGGAITEIQITINETSYTVYSNSTASAVYENFTLPAGASITLTYTTAPTWTWVPE